jgi:hypothetical protein
MRWRARISRKTTGIGLPLLPFLIVAAVVISPPGAESQANVPAKTGLERLPFSIPPGLYEKWRKYGQWDFKQQAFKYRDFTLYNFGATGAAAGFDKKALLAVAQVSNPTPKDVNSFDDTRLEADFFRNVEAFEKLRTMAEKDAHVIRIAADFTWLDRDTKWPREDIGFATARWDEYRSLFQKLSLPEGIVRTEDFAGAIFLVARSQGLCIGGSSAGYVYSAKALAPVVKSPKAVLDAEARQNPDRHYAYAFKALKANWYAFYEIDW